MSNSINKQASGGNCGPKVRSDCFVQIELKDEGGLEITVKSKVEALFGESIRAKAQEILTFFGIQNAQCYIEDRGAVDFVLAARMEMVIKQLIDTDKQYLPEILDSNCSETPKDMFRFSRLYLPGNTPKLMLNAGLHKPNGLILDLEDAVAVDKKEEARYMVRNTLRALHFYGTERMVRINQLPMGLKDLDFIIPHNVNLILLPKCESAEQIHAVNARIEEIKANHGGLQNIWIMPIIESALGVVKAFEIASSAENVVAMAVGLEDYTADLGCQRTNQGDESFYARCAVVNACKAAKIQAIDSVFSDVSDMEALAQNVLRSKSLGFDGMGCIHPRQIEVIHKNFAPNAQEILKAQKIVHAFIISKEYGVGVVSLGSKMIDAPVVKRAENTITIALNLNLIKADWREAFL